MNQDVENQLGSYEPERRTHSHRTVERVLFQTCRRKQYPGQVHYMMEPPVVSRALQGYAMGVAALVVLIFILAAKGCVS